MTILRANLRPVDHQRAARVLLAFLTGDRAALDVALDEADAEPAGTPSVVFALAETACGFAVEITHGDYEAAVEQLRRSLLALAQRDEDDHGE
jgi:hypothetical protein